MFLQLLLYGDARNHGSDHGDELGTCSEMRAAQSISDVLRTTSEGVRACCKKTGCTACCRMNMPLWGRMMTGPMACTGVLQVGMMTGACCQAGLEGGHAARGACCGGGVALLACMPLRDRRSGQQTACRCSGGAARGRAPSGAVIKQGHNAHL
jgi:hypothetical protein